MRSTIPLRRVARGTIGLFFAMVLVTTPAVVLAGHQFADVPSTHPFHDDIAWMADNDIANGYGDGTYKPGQAVIRQAMDSFPHCLSNEFELAS